MFGNSDRMSPPAWRMLRLVRGAMLGLILFGLGRSPAFGQAKPSVLDAGSANPTSASAEAVELEQATFGSGCFWCTEAIFRQLKGVHSVVSGFSGGLLRNPTYEQVLTGLTGHAEVVQVTYDPKVVRFESLLEVFWKTHDPTTLNRQGVDVGTQYRSVVFYHNESQAQLAAKIKAQLNATGAFGRPVVTEISPFIGFYPADESHQNYFERNRRKQYCRLYIAPKLDKFKKVFKDYLKSASPTD